MRCCHSWFLAVLALAVGAPSAGWAANPKQAEKSFKEGLRLEEASQWKEAEAAFSDAILNDPNGAAYYVHRARVRYFAADYPHALEDAGSATRLDPNNGAAIIGCRRAHSTAGVRRGRRRLHARNQAAAG